MIPDPREQPTLSVEEAGRLCGLGRSASYDAARRGELPTLRFGRRVVVPTAILLRNLGLQPQTNGTPAPSEGPAKVHDLRGSRDEPSSA